MTILRVPSLTIDPLQRAAAEAPEGPLVILGGPGTGKTHTIIARVAMLLKGGASPHTITCLTFSSRGAEDLRRQMENQPLTAEGAPHIFIGTIHHYASFYLRRSGHASIGISPHFTIWDQEQATEILTEIISRRQEGKEGASAHDIRKIMDWYETNQTRTPEEEEPAEEAVWLEIIREYNQEKRDNNTLGLEDLIPLAVRAMELNAESREAWSIGRSRHLLIDEFQDITPRQYRLVQMMTGPTTSITVAADPNQSINGWKGADPKTLLQFRLNHGSRLNTRMLKINHRGTSTLSEVASRLTRSDEMKGLVYDYQSAIRVEGPKPTLVQFRGTPNDMDRYILNSAENLVGEGYRWEDMACIYRTHQTINRMATQLSGRSIPHNILGDTQRDRNSNARCITALLALALNPSDTKAFSIAAAVDSNSRPRQLNKEIAKKIAKDARDNKANIVEAAERHLEHLREGTSSHRNLQYVTKAWREMNEMLNDPRNELYDICRRANTMLLNARKPGSAATEEPQTFRLMSLSQTTPRLGQENLREFTARFLELMASALQPDHQSSENEDPFSHRQGITFGTIHSTKGMQWKIVWVVDANDNDLPSMRWNSGDEELMEEERVFYVAATRATDQLHFCYADPEADEEEDRKEVKASRFLAVLEDMLESKEVKRASSPTPPGSGWNTDEQPTSEEPGNLEEGPEEEPEQEPEMGD